MEILDSVTEIGDLAFYDCDSLGSVEIPNSVIFISDGVFEDCANVTLTVEHDSYADQWAKDNGVICIYPDSSSRLHEE